MKTWIIVGLTTLLLVGILIAGFSVGNQNDNGKQPNNHSNPTDNTHKQEGNKTKNNSEDILWGIDTASKITDSFLQCVKDNYGKPAFAGRYLETKPGYSYGLTKEEIAFLHKHEVKVLTIYNQFHNAEGYEHGKAEANQAIKLANQLGIPAGVAIFADVEPTYSINDGFLKGWILTINHSKYQAGIYGVFRPYTSLTNAYQALINKNITLHNKVVLWSSSTAQGVTKKGNAPDFNPSSPNEMNIAIWQYGLEGKQCNIDTNLINSSTLKALW